MMNSLYAAATGMAAQQMQLDVIANNLANVNTTGFKSSRVGFQDLFYQQISARQSARLGAQVGMGSAVTSTSVSWAQGQITSTEDPLHVAITGRGFFKVEAPNTPTGFAYTRSGDFRLDASGQLVTQSGYRLVPPIMVPAGADQDKLSISPQGVVTIPVNGQIQQLGQIMMSDFVNPGGLQAIGDSLYAPTANAGVEAVGLPGGNGMGRLQQGALEGSNVSVMKEMIDMITTQRAFESVSKVINTSDEMLAMANGMRR